MAVTKGSARRRCRRSSSRARRAKGTTRPPSLERAVEQHMRIDAHQLAVLVGVAVAGARHARPDVAHHRTGVAADLVVGLAHRFGSARIAARTRSGVAGARVQAHAGRVMDRVEDRRRGRDQRLLADALGAERAFGGRRPRSGCIRPAACRRWSGSDNRAGSRRGAGRIPPSARGRAPAPRRPRSGLRPASG